MLSRRARSPVVQKATRSKRDQNLEPAPEHTHPVEGHRFGGPYRPCAGDSSVDAIALLARLVNDPRKDDRLVWLELDGLRERRDLARLNVVADAFDVLERAILLSYLAGFLRELPVEVHVLFREGKNETIHILSHCQSPCTLIEPNSFRRQWLCLEGA